VSLNVILKNHIGGILKFFKLLFVIFLFQCSPQITKVVQEPYKKSDFKGKVMAIAPINHIQRIGQDFYKRYPEIDSPLDSMNNAIRESILRPFHKFSEFRAVYYGKFREMPEFERVELTLSKEKSFKVELPNANSKVDIIPIKEHLIPDYIFFITIKEMTYIDSETIGATVTILLDSGTIMAGISIKKYRGLLFQGLKYYLWDNIERRVAFYGNEDILIPFYDNNRKTYIDEENPFAVKNNIMDLLIRHILTRTPISKPGMLYY